MASQFYITRANSMGYVTAYCTDGDWHGYERSKYPGQRTLFRSPTIKVWKTKAGAQRWLNERPGMSDYATIRSR